MSAKVSAENLRKSRVNYDVIKGLISSWDITTLALKYQKVYPILGSGFWSLSFTAESETEAYRKIIDLGSKSLNYKPCVAILNNPGYKTLNIEPNLSKMYIIIEVFFPISGVVGCESNPTIHVTQDMSLKIY
jgi:hypothetical protein